MKLELVVVFFPPDLAISRALNRVSKIEAVMMSHDPAKNNSMALTWLLPCQAGQGPRLWGAKAWRPAQWPKPPEDLRGAPFQPPEPGPSSLTAQHTAAFSAQRKAQARLLLLPFSPATLKTLAQVSTGAWGAEGTPACTALAVCL